MLDKAKIEYSNGTEEAYLEPRRLIQRSQEKNRVIGTEQVVGAIVVSELKILMKGIRISLPTIESGNPINTS